MVGVETPTIFKRRTGGVAESNAPTVCSPSMMNPNSYVSGFEEEKSRASARNWTVGKVKGIMEKRHVEVYEGFYWEIKQTLKGTADKPLQSKFNGKTLKPSVKVTEDEPIQPLGAALMPFYSSVTRRLTPSHLYKC
eukprot:1159858-Pelagomonas_calceolata.AAC.11